MSKKPKFICPFCADGDIPIMGRHYIKDTAVNATHSHMCREPKKGKKP